MNHTEFQKYEQPYLPGVKLPEIVLTPEQKAYAGVDGQDISNYDFLRQLCWQGIKKRGIDQLDNKQDYYERTKEELKIFEELGFVDYVLLNWDILNYCHENDIPVGAGRGSAAGSLVLYLIKVTNIDPIKYDLFFERFVSKTRARKIEVDGETYLDGSLLADVDNDIAYDRRSEVIEYIEQKHRGRTAKILTLNTLSSKLCLKECGKIVACMDETAVHAMVDYIPEVFGRPVSIDDALEQSEELREYQKQYPEVFHIASILQGLNKNTGVHPSGICISRFSLEEIMPVQTTKEGALVTGYDMNDVADLSVKFDILGLRTLTVVADTCKQLGIDHESIDPTDKSIYIALQSLEDPKGLFQIEANTNFRVCQEVSPRNLEHLSAVVAIARPGALDFKDLYSEYIKTGEFQSTHEFFDDVLKYTGGIPLYQEQLMKMAVKIGFTLENAETLRHIVGKKKVDQMPEWKAKIEDKISENKLDPAIGDLLWKVAEDSANYSFNKSHSISYANLAAITVFLKFNHPQEFFVSLLKSACFEPNPHEEIHKISQEINHFGIKLLPPDLNKSQKTFSVEGDDIRYGLEAIKGVSDKVINGLLELRGQSFEHKYDFFLTAKQVGLNIGNVSALIQAGMLDSFVDFNRCRLVLEAQTFNILTDREKVIFTKLGPKHNYDILKSVKIVNDEQMVDDKNRRIMTDKRFETFKKKYEPYKKIYELNRQHMSFANWYFENHLLGYSYSENLRSVFNDNSLINAESVLNSVDGTMVKIIGNITESVKRTSKKTKNLYYRVTISDESGSFDCLFMNTARGDKLTQFLEDGGQIPKKGEIATIIGRKNDNIVFVDNILPLNEKIYLKLSELK